MRLTGRLHTVWAGLSSLLSVQNAQQCERINVWHSVCPSPFLPVERTRRRSAARATGASDRPLPACCRARRMGLRSLYSYCSRLRLREEVCRGTRSIESRTTECTRRGQGNTNVSKGDDVQCDRIRNHMIRHKALDPPAYLASPNTSAPWSETRGSRC